ncbi:Ig-like domain repeat protein [Streptomyces sp. NPDC005892]|uniref:RCC1 domain-containing protein n=1 Tax=Streptomyces sp. NPDC005892 TaxID=3155593 RepID=UPI0033D4E84B
MALGFALCLSVLTAPGAAAQTGGGGQVLTWGRNTYGQLGNGTTAPSAQPGSLVPIPASLPQGTRVTAVSGGYGHSVALTSTGEVLAWGQNDAGQLGDGTFTNSTVPVEVSLPAGTRVTAIDSGDDFVLALTSAGDVLAWGYNEWGQLGNGTTGTDSNVPVEVDLPAGATVTEISAGAGHALALTSAGEVLSWGDNDLGQLGDGTTTSRDEPAAVDLPAGTARTIAAGDDHSLALSSTGSTLAWGYNGDGQLGDGTTTTRTRPVETHVPDGVTVTSLAAGSGFQSFALTTTDEVLAWGDNSYGQLGDGTTTRRTVPVEVSLPTGTRVTSIDSGDDHTVALTSTGDVLAWGYNRYGQVGDGTTTNHSVPVEVALPTGTIALAIGTGSYHSLAVADEPSTTTTLTVDPSEADVDEAVTFTATVTCNVDTPTGDVTFTDGQGVQLGTAPLNGNGVATLTTSELTEGTHTVTAHYAGDGTCPASTSEAVTVTITDSDDGDNGNGGDDGDGNDGNDGNGNDGNGNGGDGNGGNGNEGNGNGNNGNVNDDEDDVTNNGNHDNIVTGSGQNCSVTNTGTPLISILSPSTVNCVNAPKGATG